MIRFIVNRKCHHFKLKNRSFRGFSVAQRHKNSVSVILFFFFSLHLSNVFMCFFFSLSSFSEQGDRVGWSGRGLHRTNSEPHPPIGRWIWHKDLQSERAGEPGALCKGRCVGWQMPYLCRLSPVTGAHVSNVSHRLAALLWWVDFKFLAACHK